MQIASYLFIVLLEIMAGELNKEVETFIVAKMDENNRRFEDKLLEFQSKMLQTMSDQYNQHHNGNGSGGFRGRGNRSRNRRGGNPGRGHPNGNQNQNHRGQYRGRGRNFDARGGNGNGRSNRNSNGSSGQDYRNVPQSQSNEKDSSDLNEAFTDPKVKKVYENPLLPKDSRISKKWTREDAEIFRGKFGTNSEQQYLKQFTDYSIVESQSGANRCALELIINCIPKFFGTYAQNDDHDMREAIRVLQTADTKFKPDEVVNVQRHPGQSQETVKDFIRVTVLLDNVRTPDRIATMSEKNRGENELIQRSLTKGLRGRNKSLEYYVTNLNLLRPLNTSYLWSTVKIRGEKHIVQNPDPSYVVPTETETEEKTIPETEKKTSSEKPTVPMPGIFSAVENLKIFNRKMAQTAPSAPMQNIPELKLDEVMADLRKKHGGNMELACKELLIIQGVTDKRELRNKKDSK